MTDEHKAGIRIVGTAMALVLLSACGVPFSSVEEEHHEPLFLGSTAAPNQAPGEYIVTVSAGAGEDLLRRQYRIYGIRDITDLGADMFLLRLGNDPGLDAVQRKASESGQVRAVQPNYIYQDNR